MDQFERRKDIRHLWYVLPDITNTETPPQTRELAPSRNVLKRKQLKQSPMPSLRSTPSVIQLHVSAPVSSVNGTTSVKYMPLTSPKS